MTKKERIAIEVKALEWAERLADDLRGNDRDGRDRRWKAVGEVLSALRAEIERRKKE